MGDWCRQDGHRKPKRNYGKGKEVDDFIEIIFSKKKTETSVKRGSNEDREQKSL